MDAETLIAAIDAYARTHAGERETVERFRALLAAGDAAFERDHLDPGHVTASAWVVDPGGDAVVLLRHAKLGIWVQPGGHADGEADVLAVARREAEEETGLGGLTLVSRVAPAAGVPTPFDLDVHAIPARGAEPAHLHFDVRYAFRSSARRLERNAESHALAWVPLDELARYTHEESVLRMARKWRGGAHRET